MQHVSLCLCSLLAATSQFSIPIGQKMQLTGWENANNVRNATCAASKTSKVPMQDALLFISYSMTLPLRILTFNFTFIFANVYYSLYAHKNCFELCKLQHHGEIDRELYSSIATPSWSKKTIYKLLSFEEYTIQEKYFDERFLSYNGDMSINFLSILCHQFVRMPWWIFKW